MGEKEDISMKYYSVVCESNFLVDWVRFRSFISNLYVHVAVGREERKSRLDKGCRCTYGMIHLMILIT